jgi:hypothetical protein
VPECRGALHIIKKKTDGLTEKLAKGYSRFESTSVAFWKRHNCGVSEKGSLVDRSVKGDGWGVATNCDGGCVSLCSCQNA